MATVHLRPLAIGDTNNIVKWRNLQSVKNNLFSQAVLRPEEHMAYFNNIVQTGKCAQFIIVIDEKTGQKDIGTIFIKNIDHENHKGEYGIFIGEESARGNGYAKAATALIIEFAFKELKLNRVYLQVMEDNKNAIRVYENAGFIKEGIMREAFLKNDKYINIIMMSLLKCDWERN